MATNLWVLFSSARTTSEKAPLKQKAVHTSEKERDVWVYEVKSNGQDQEAEVGYILLSPQAMID